MTLDNPYFVSAYGMAVKSGFVGSPEDWMESLKACIHIKYAETAPTCDADMKDEPADWMGVCTSWTKEAPEDYRDYKWQYVKGTANAELLAPQYTSGTQYAKGEIVRYGEYIYQAKQNVSDTEWTASHWKKTTVGEVVQTLLTEAGDIAEAVRYTEQTLTDAKKTQALANLGLPGPAAILSTDKAMLKVNSAWVVNSLPAAGNEGRIVFLKV